MQGRNMLLGLIISFFFPGLGLAYTGETEKGLIIFIVWLVLSLLAYFVLNFIGILGFIVWIYSLYATYQSLKQVSY